MKPEKKKKKIKMGLNRHFSKENMQIPFLLRKVYEKMFNITNHQKNANGNHNKLSLPIKILILKKIVSVKM